MPSLFHSKRTSDVCLGLSRIIQSLFLHLPLHHLITFLRWDLEVHCFNTQEQLSNNPLLDLVVTSVAEDTSVSQLTFSCNGTL
jgi:hypothetical protein